MQIHSRPFSGVTPSFLNIKDYGDARDYKKVRRTLIKIIC